MAAAAGMALLCAGALSLGAAPAQGPSPFVLPVQAPAVPGAPEADLPSARPPGAVQGRGAQFPGELIKPNAKDPEATRKEVLEDLFTRLSQAGDEESASVIADAIEKIWMRSGSDTIDLLMQRALQLIQSEDYDTALDILDSIVEMAPDYAEGWNQRATVFFLKKDFRRSLDDLRHVLALEPRHFKAIAGLGLIMQELGDKEAALKAFRKALQVYPQLSDTREMEKELAREVEGQGI